MSQLLDKPFQKMGARVRVNPPRNRWSEPDTIALDIRRDEHGEYFELIYGSGKKTEVTVLDVRPEDRHLLLMARTEEGNNKFLKQKFLCGHDERHWFVAGIPETAGVTNVEQAKEALKPQDVRNRELSVRLPKTEKHKRANAAWRRQGEWFFIPMKDYHPSELLLRKNEPFTRGRGKPHYAEQALRTGGTDVWVSGSTVLTLEQYAALDEDAKRKRNYQLMKENAELYVRGKISHPDHATVKLDFWHKVLMNEEHRSLAMRSVRFLD